MSWLFDYLSCDHQIGYLSYDQNLFFCGAFSSDSVKTWCHLFHMVISWEGEGGRRASSVVWSFSGLIYPDLNISRKFQESLLKRRQFILQEGKWIVRAILHVVNFGLGATVEAWPAFLPGKMHWESVWYLCTQNLSEEGQRVTRAAVSGLVVRQT